MNIRDLLKPELLLCNLECQSKKRALETIAQQLASYHKPIEANDVFSALLERERLGSTGLGKGIGIPHCHLKDLPQAFAVLATLRNGIDFDAIDEQPVDIIISLMVPDGQEQQHLDTLASIVQLLENQTLLEQLRNADNTDRLKQILNINP